MPVNSPLDADQIRRVREQWQYLNATHRYAHGDFNPIQDVRGLEERTLWVATNRPEALNRSYYRAPGLEGYHAWLNAFQALENRLTPDDHQRINRASSVLQTLQSDLASIGRNPSPADIRILRNTKLETLQTQKEVFLATGHRTHFNIVRIRQLNDGSYTRTLYDAGHETSVIRKEADGQGNKVSIVHAVEERKIKPGTNIAVLLDAELSKQSLDKSSRGYRDVKASIEGALETKPIRVVEDHAQGRSNCVTRGQRILIQDLVGNKSVTDRMHAFITDSRVSPPRHHKQIKSTRARASGESPCERKHIHRQKNRP